MNRGLYWFFAHLELGKPEWQNDGKKERRQCSALHLMGLAARAPSQIAFSRSRQRKSKEAGRFGKQVESEEKEKVRAASVLQIFISIYKRTNLFLTMRNTTRSDILQWKGACNESKMIVTFRFKTNLMGQSGIIP